MENQPRLLTNAQEAYDIRIEYKKRKKKQVEEKQDVLQKYAMLVGEWVQKILTIAFVTLLITMYPNLNRKKKKEREKGNKER